MKLKTWHYIFFVIALIIIFKSTGFLGAFIPITEAPMNEITCLETNGSWLVQNYDSYCGNITNCTVSTLSMTYCDYSGVKVLNASAFRLEHLTLPMTLNDCVSDSGTWDNGTCYCPTGKLITEGFCAEHTFTRFVEDTNETEEVVEETQSSGGPRITETIIIGIECSADETYDETQKRCILNEPEITIQEPEKNNFWLWAFITALITTIIYLVTKKK